MMLLIVLRVAQLKQGRQRGWWWTTGEGEIIGVIPCPGRGTPGVGSPRPSCGQPACHPAWGATAMLYAEARTNSMSHEPDRQSPDSLSGQMLSQAVMARFARRLFRRRTASQIPTTSHPLNVSAIRSTPATDEPSVIRLFSPLLLLIVIL